MRRALWLTIAVVSFVLVSTNVFAEVTEPDSGVQDGITQDGKDKEYILSLVNTVEVEALIKDSCKLYSDEARKKYVKTLPKGEKVKLLRDKSQKTAYIKLKDGSKGWVSYNLLSVPEISYVNNEPLTDEQKTLYVNYKEYDSSTKYLVWVNVERQQVNVFLGSIGKWKLINTILCSSGKNDTPTINGEFEYYNLYKKRPLKDYYVYNFMRYYDTFAIHSIPFNYNNTVNDGVLGEPRSHGCIRISVEDSAWLVKYIPLKTKVIVN